MLSPNRRNYGRAGCPAPDVGRAAHSLQWISGRDGSGRQAGVADGAPAGQRGADALEDHLNALNTPGAEHSPRGATQLQPPQVGPAEAALQVRPPLGAALEVTRITGPEGPAAP